MKSRGGITGEDGFEKSPSLSQAALTRKQRKKRERNEIMEKVRLQIDEEIPVIAEADVLVVGGGPGGLGASVMAARAGASVILAERCGILGGMASQGEVSPFMGNHYTVEKKDGEVSSFTLDKPVYPQWVAKMADYLPGTLREECEKDSEVLSWNSRIVSKDIAPMAMEDLCLEAGVRILYHHNLVGVHVEEGKIAWALFSSKSGFVAIRAKNYVDCTGDGDLAVMAGCPFEFGGPSGNCQPMTLCFKLDHIDRSRVPRNLSELYNQAKAAGKLDCPRENVLYFSYYDDDVIHFNTTRIIGKSGVNGLELSEAELEGHRQFKEFFHWLRSEVPGFEKVQIRSIASHIGIRESRRIKGRCYLEREAFRNRAKFEDAIARCNYPIDIHNPDGTGTEHEFMPSNEYYEIPYGCIIPEGIGNLSVGGRPISVDHAIHASSRVMPPACSVGQAAGVAAALSVASGIPLPELDGKLVRAKLVEMGAFLN